VLLRNAVDALGGVQVMVDAPLQYTDRAQGLTIDLEIKPFAGIDPNALGADGAGARTAEIKGLDAGALCRGNDARVVTVCKQEAVPPVQASVKHPR